MMGDITYIHIGNESNEEALSCEMRLDILPDIRCSVPGPLRVDTCGIALLISGRT